MGLGVVWMLLASAALVLLVLWTVRVLFPDFAHEEHGGRAGPPPDVPRERFARGETDRGGEPEPRRTSLRDRGGP